MANVKIYSNRCWLEGGFFEATVMIEDGIISGIQKGKPKDFGNITDIGDNILMPGVIDVHVHVNEPGRTDWEGFDTATKAAAAGGITTIIDMPLNSSPVTTSAKALNEKLIASEGKLHVNCGFYGGLVPGNQSDLEELMHAGVLGIKAFLIHSGIDEFPNIKKEEIEQAMPLIAQHHLPLLVHCEIDDKKFNQELTLHPTSYNHYLASRPDSWEANAVELMIGLCRKHRCATHIVHVSSATVLGMIQKAKEERLPLTAETCPHYIYFFAEDIPDGETLFKCAPPIRDKMNNQMLKDALSHHVLDFIASDHSPAPPSMKEIGSGNLQNAWGGVAGLQFLLSASWSSLRNTLRLDKFIPLLTEHPAQFLKINHRKGYIKEGLDADLVIWSPEESFKVKQESILHKHKISPYVSHQLFGRIYHSYVNGELVFSNNKIIQKNAGKWLLRK